MTENANNDKQDNMKENAPTLSTVTIDLDALDSTKALGEGELIFDEECHSLVDNIRKTAGRNIEKLKSKDSSVHNDVDEDTQGTPNCFFINGQRGSGKSTLLRAVRHNLVHGDNSTKKETAIKLFSLADVDPTELGRGENFFIYLLGKIYALLDSAFKKSNNNDITIHLIRDAMQSLREMSSGLQILMDSEGVLRNDNTPEFFLENCLEKCADSSIMRTKLSSLMNTLAMIVKTDVFLVTIDDADLHFGKCEDVLEYVRKYMQSPRIIFLFAGDMQLYSHIVRGMQLQNFHEKQLKHDHQNKRNREQLLDSLEEQYLLKLFPFDKRIRTTKLSSKIDGGQQIRIKYIGSDDKIHTHDIKEILSWFLRVREGAHFIDTILQLPLRSILFLLRLLVKNTSIEESSEITPYIWKYIQDIFQQSLLGYDVDYTKIIETQDIGLLQKEILGYYAKEEQWNADLSMNTTGGNARAKQVALSLSGAVSQTTISLSTKLKYWCACFPLWQRIREENIYTANANNTRDLLESCLKRSNEQYGSQWANLACASMAPNFNEDFLFGRGTICILNEDCAQNNEIGQDARIGFQTFVETITKKESNGTQKEMLVHAALSACLCRIDDSRSSYFYLSVYHLLMYIAEWLDFGEKLLIRHSQANRTNAQNTVSEDIKDAIKEKLSKPLITPGTERIRTLLPQAERAFTRNALHTEYADNKGEYISSMSHNAFVYSWQPGNIAITELYDWIKKYAGSSYISSPVDYYLAWEAFKAKCIELTYGSITEYRHGKTSPDCASIFSAYLSAVEHAMAFLSDQTQIARGLIDTNTETDKQTIKNCIIDFPLWKHLKHFLDPKENANCHLKKVRIGYFVNAERKRVCRGYRNTYRTLLSEISNLEAKTKAAQSKLDVARHELVDAKTIQNVTDSKYKRIQKTIFEISHKCEELDSKTKELLESELQAKQTIDQLQTQRQGITDLINQKNQQGKSEKTRKEVLANDRISEIGLAKVQDDILRATFKLKATVREKVKIGNELLELRKRLDEFFQLEFSTRVDLEAARIKCSAAQKLYAETLAHADLLAKHLEEGKQKCAKAEETYLNYRTSPTDE